MASINDKGIIDQITSNKGVYESGGESDPAVTHIIEYGNMFDGRTTYSLAWSEAEFKNQWQTGFFAWKRLYWTLEKGFSGDHLKDDLANLSEEQADRLMDSWDAESLEEYRLP